MSSENELEKARFEDLFDGEEAEKMAREEENGRADRGRAESEDTSEMAIQSILKEVVVDERVESLKERERVGVEMKEEGTNRLAAEPEQVREKEMIPDIIVEDVDNPMKNTTTPSKI